MSKSHKIYLYLWQFVTNISKNNEKTGTDYIKLSDSPQKKYSLNQQKKILTESNVQNENGMAIDNEGENENNDNEN